MDNLKHVTNTWLLAQALHPGVFYSSLIVYKDSWEFDPGIIVFLIVFGFLFSICSYVLCIFSFKLVRWTELPIHWKFCLWFLLVAMCVPSGIEISFALLFQDGDFLFGDAWQLIVPGIIAALLAVLLRYRQFFSTVKDPEFIIE